MTAMTEACYARQVMQMLAWPWKAQRDSYEQQPSLGSYKPMAMLLPKQQWLWYGYAS